MGARRARALLSTGAGLAAVGRQPITPRKRRPPSAHRHHGDRGRRRQFPPQRRSSASKVLPWSGGGSPGVRSTHFSVPQLMQDQRPGCPRLCDGRGGAVQAEGRRDSCCSRMRACLCRPGTRLPREAGLGRRSARLSRKGESRWESGDQASAAGCLPTRGPARGLTFIGAAIWGELLYSADRAIASRTPRAYFLTQSAARSTP